jgi:glycosyltransferase involved in cell wall biosynthesis
VLHTYLLLALVLRRRGVKVIVEFHEVQDPGEAEMPLVAAYVRRVAPWLFRRADGYVVHSEYDRALLHERFDLPERPTAVIPHATYDHYRQGNFEREAPEDVYNLLFFGLIRPYKGLEDLVAAYSALTPEEAAEFSLTVVGETWEGWTEPAQRIAACPHPVTFVNRYVSDEEAAAFFADADAVVLPYRRGSASGPLQIAMSLGLHAVLYRVGGLVEAVRDYAGATLVEPDDVDALRRALLDLRERRAERFADPHSWARTVHEIDALCKELA